MNERIKNLAEQAGFALWEDEEWKPHGEVIDWSSRYDDELEKFAQLIVQECTMALFDESERLSGLYSEEDNMQLAEEYEICSNQCINDIAIIEKHFGVKE